MQTLISLALPLLLLTGCAAVAPPPHTTEPPPAQAAAAPSTELWEVSPKQHAYEAESIAGKVTLPVAYAEMQPALQMLAQRSFVPLSSSQAAKLIGKPFSARKALEEEAAEQTSRADYFAKLHAETPGDTSRQEAEREYRAEAKRLLAQRSKVRPYLMRAIGLPGCGTGSFSVRRQGDEVWTTFVGLGSGYTSARQAVIVYLDRPPALVHVGAPATCL